MSVHSGKLHADFKSLTCMVRIYTDCALEISRFGARAHSNSPRSLIFTNIDSATNDISNEIVTILLYSKTSFKIGRGRLSQVSVKYFPQYEKEFSNSLST